MLNKIILIGRLSTSPEMRYTGNGTPVTNFNLAVERSYQSGNGEKEVDFIDIVTWRKIAEVCAKHLDKGRLVAIEGSLQIRKSENNGRKYINPEVVAQNVRFLDWGKDSNSKKSSSQTKNNQSNNSNDSFEDDMDNIPF